MYNQSKIILFYIVSLVLYSCSNTHTLLRKQKNCEKHFDKELGTDIYSFVDKMPHYEGDEKELFNFIIKNINYDRKNDAQSSVYISFVVNKTGHLQNIKIYKKSEEEYTSLEKQVLQVFTSMPKWIPGECNNKKVSVQFILPIKLSFQ